MQVQCIHKKTVYSVHAHIYMYNAEYSIEKTVKLGPEPQNFSNLHACATFFLFKHEY